MEGHSSSHTTSLADHLMPTVLSEPGRRMKTLEAKTLGAGPRSYKVFRPAPNPERNVGHRSVKRFVTVSATHEDAA